jgi:hypothetical protein
VTLEALAGEPSDGVTPARLDARLEGVHEPVDATLLQAVGEQLPDRILSPLQGVGSGESGCRLHECGHPLGVAERKGERRGAAHRAPDQRRTLDRAIVHHRPQVRHELPVVVCGSLGRSGGVAVAAGVVRDQPVPAAL